MTGLVIKLKPNEKVLVNGVILQNGAIIGPDGYGFAQRGDGTHYKIVQAGKVVIEDDGEIQAGRCIDSAVVGETRIGRGTKIDNLVQIGHNCDIGEGVLIVAQTGLSGSTKVGDGAMLMAQSGAANGVKIGERAFVAARAGVVRDVPAGGRTSGFPNLDHAEQNRILAALRRLPQLVTRLRAVERKLGLREPRGEDGKD